VGRLACASTLLSVAREERAEAWPKPAHIRRKRGPLGLKILVVDDDATALASLESFLVGDGHVIYTAQRGEEAVVVARRFRRERRRLDLTILDYRMPDLSGIETFEQLVVELPEVQGIFVSGDPSSTLDVLVERVGGLALMRKPLSLPRVRSVLDSFERGNFSGREV
jgi:DNA-binding response OmpR family regulator